MSTTLTNGLKLPDKGSVDWYADMQNNYAILDGAVGTIAEHTTALAGKAPLVHTHTKSDITDLFNSANTWSGSQTYSKTTISGAAEVLHCKNANVALGETPASDYQKLFMFKDKNNDNFGYYRHLYQTTGSSQFDILVRNKFTNGAPDTSGSIDYLSFSLRLNADKSKEGVLMGSFKPSNTNTYDLGSSSYQWNNLYAKKVNTQSLNGCNPGALSLPSGGTTENTDWFNVAGDILPTGGNATSFNRATANYFTPAKDGWLALAVRQCSELSVWCENLKYGISIVAPDASLNRQVVIPVVAGKIYQILITGNGWVSARLIMPKGNV